MTRLYYKAGKACVSGKDAISGVALGEGLIEEALDLLLVTTRGRRGAHGNGHQRQHDSCDPSLSHSSTDGRTFWFSEPSPESKPKPGIVDLVQIYDELVMGYSESRDALWSPGIDLEVTAPLWHAVLLDGRVIGHWRRVIGKDEVVVEASFY